jgi:hypothetical protein
LGGLVDLDKQVGVCRLAKHQHRNGGGGQYRDEVGDTH